MYNTILLYHNNDICLLIALVNFIDNEIISAILITTYVRFQIIDVKEQFVKKRFEFRLLFKALITISRK